MSSKIKNYNKSSKFDFITYGVIVAAFIIVSLLSSQGILGRSHQGLLVPACCYIVMAISLNLTVGVLGELSLGHAGFMSVGAFTGIVCTGKAWSRYVSGCLYGWYSRYNHRNSGS